MCWKVSLNSTRWHTGITVKSPQWKSQVQSAVAVKTVTESDSRRCPGVSYMAGQFARVNDDGIKEKSPQFLSVDVRNATFHLDGDDTIIYS